MHLFVPIKFTALNVWATEMEIIAAVSMHAECNDLLFFIIGGAGGGGGGG